MTEGSDQSAQSSRSGASPDEVVPGTSDLPTGSEAGAASVPTGNSSDAGGGAASRVAPGAPPPATNQAKVEPIAPTSAHVEPDAGPSGVRQPDSGVGTVSSADPQSPNPPGLERAGTRPTEPTPGTTSGVSVPHAEAAPGTSENSGTVSGVKDVALAPPGSPDGEVDTTR